MNQYIKDFLHRGMLFGGFGPIIAGFVYWSIDRSLPDFSLSGGEVLLGILSTYVLAFVQAGASVFNQIEHWPLTKSLFFHFSALYVVYVLCYLVNRWIPFEPMILVLFTVVFVLIYAVIWLTVYLSVRHTEKRLNKKIQL